MKFSSITFASLRAGALLLLGLLSASADAPSIPKTSSAKWEKDIAALEAADKANPPPQGAILFIGASGIRMWTTLAEDFPNHKVINRGFGGSMTSDSVAFVDRIVIPYKPSTIILQAGGNDINAGKTPETVLADTREFVGKVRAALPDTRIIFMGLGPSEARWTQAESQKKANALLRELAATGKNMDFIDVWDAFLGPDGKPNGSLFIEDKLHHNAKGYKLRVKLTTPHLPAPK